MFYTSDDDYLFHMHLSQEFLDSTKLTILDAQDKKFVKFISNDKTQEVINIDELPDLWNIYFFDPSTKAKQVDMTMIDDEYKNYFN